MKQHLRVFNGTNDWTNTTAGCDCTSRRQATRAERLYRAILGSQPQHPDANHNLGVLAVSVNKTDAGLPLFKTALEANPKIEQFWLSYIDALIKEKQLDNAKQVLEQAKKQVVAGEKLNVLEAQLASINETENVVPQTHLSNN